MHKPDREILNAQQAAEYLGITLDTLRQKVQRRELPHFRMSDKPNGHLRFRQSDLDAWIDARLVPATGPLPVVVSKLRRAR